MSRSELTILLASPRGFCAGVERAIDIVERGAAPQNGAPVYVRHEIVHNRHVVDELRAQGAVFVEELDEVPEDGAGRVLGAWRAEGRAGRGASAPAALSPTPPARWSARSIARSSGTAGTAGRCC